MKFPALAFDLDGTLYPNYRLYFRLIPFILRKYRLLRAFGMARTRIRKSYEYSGAAVPLAEACCDDHFYINQAGIMAELLGEPVDIIMEKTDRLIYRGWEPHFKKIKLFPHVRDTLEAFRDAGIKLGLLSDFPPEIKLENLKIPGFWDAVVCSERVGRLKPHPVSFLELARQMETPPEQILYVGNSISYDVSGARNAGMKAAHIRRQVFFSGLGGFDALEGDAAVFCFSDYRQLRDYVLS